MSWCPGGEGEEYPTPSPHASPMPCGRKVEEEEEGRLCVPGPPLVKGGGHGGGPLFLWSGLPRSLPPLPLPPTPIILPLMPLCLSLFISLVTLYLRGLHMFETFVCVGCVCPADSLAFPSLMAPFRHCPRAMPLPPLPWLSSPI